MNVEDLMNIQVTPVARHPEKLIETASAIQVTTHEDIRRSENSPDRAISARTRLACVAKLRKFLPALLWGALGLTVFLRGAGGAEAPTEYQVKAVFVYNFTRFVEWPSQTFTAPDEPFVIGVLGSDPFGHAMWVTAVNGDGTITVQQYNLYYDGNYYETTIPSSGLTYIYFGG